MKLLLSETYDIVTAESAINGSTTEDGFITKDAEVDLHEAIEAIENLGADHHGGNSFYAADSTFDMYTGETERRAIHIGGSERAMKWFRLAVDMRFNGWVPNPFTVPPNKEVVIQGLTFTHERDEDGDPKSEIYVESGRLSASLNAAYDGGEWTSGTECYPILPSDMAVIKGVYSWFENSGY